MAEVVWTDPALSDLDAIADYIALDKPDAAKRWVRKVFDRVERLGGFPETGTFIRELRPSRVYRQVTVRPGRVFYRYDSRAEVVYVLGVMRGERLFRQDLLGSRYDSKD